MLVSHPLFLLNLGLLTAYAEEVPYPTSSEEANKTYSSVGRRVLQQLHDDAGNQTTTFYVVLYAGGCTPLEGVGMGPPVCECMEHETGDPRKWDYREPKVIFPMDGYTSVNVFSVADGTNKTSSKEFQDEWARVQGIRDKILKDTFNTDSYFPECIHLLYHGTNAAGFYIGNDKPFRAVAAFRCALRFVWYELGWTYFEAYWTNSDYVLSYTNGATRWAKEECGTIVFFP